MSTSIYVLKLEDNCWYVGRSVDVAKRVESHFLQQGSAWTKIHKPISLEKTYTAASAFDEDYYVNQYMLKYGRDKVRGGTYSQPKLESSLTKVIQRELWGAQDLCFLCGRPHFVTNCYARKDVNGNAIVRGKEPKEPKEPKDSDEETESLINNGTNCVRTICLIIYKFFQSFLTVPPTN